MTYFTMIVDFFMRSVLPFVVVMNMLIACREQDQTAAVMESPVAPGDAVTTLEVAPGFRVELVASEPLIADPVAMEIDEEGNMYVVENHGYPLDKAGVSRVKLLRDTDGDGRMDTATIFADSLVMPTGVLRWKKGILVTDAPHLWYMEDTDADGTADSLSVVITGFSLSNPQHNVNTPILGLDNWVYIAHERAVGTEVYKDAFGDPGTEIYFPGDPGGTRLPQNASGKNVRIRPDTRELEMLASTTQYGHTFDEWGNHLLVNNSHHLMHAVVAGKYLDRNQRLLVATSTSFVSDHGNAAEVFPITHTPDRQLLTDAGVMTSACGLVYYGGGAFPEAFNRNTTFVAEPVSNIVHADRLKPDGSTFTASRVFEKKEFLASTDMWFRPVYLYTGPDGALYVVDYYREIIEHPEWLSDDVIRSGALYNGKDMGRIYRITATGDRAVSGERLSPGVEKVRHLAHPNIWWRRNTQRLLIDERPSGLTAALVKMARQDSSAVGRLHALWTLEGIGSLDAALVTAALRDPEAGVRLNAIRLAELHLGEWPALATALTGLQDDEDAMVRFQLLCTLGWLTSPEAAVAREKMLFRDIADEFVQVAALSASSANQEAMLKAVLQRYDARVRAYATLVENLVAMVAADNPRSGYTLLRKALVDIPSDSVTWQVPALKGLARAYGRQRNAVNPSMQKLLLTAVFKHPAPAVRDAALGLLQAAPPAAGAAMVEATRTARQRAADTDLAETERARAIRFLALKDPSPDANMMEEIVLRDSSLMVRLAALRTLSEIPGERVVHFALQHWQRLEPNLQDAALQTFMDSEARMKLLLENLEAGAISAASVGWQRSIRLMTQRNVELRNRARTFFANDGRQKVIDDYQPALAASGDPARGQLVYQKSCAICHQRKGRDGIAFGPDLGTVQSWPPQGILSNILDPNQSISHGYDLWNVVLETGESWQGVIVAETSSSLTLRDARGQVNTFARGEIASQKAMNMSAMPEGLEREITQQQMADLLAFLKAP